MTTEVTLRDGDLVVFDDDKVEVVNLNRAIFLAQPVASASMPKRHPSTASKPLHWFSWIPTRILPRRVNDEVVGDAIERLETLQIDGGPRWRVRLLNVALLFVILGECVRYAVRCMKGKRAE